MNFSQAQLNAIYALGIGYGTEGGRNPYAITVTTQGSTGGTYEALTGNRWGGTPYGNSGYTIGIVQFDFGVQPVGYSSQFVYIVAQWVRDQRLAAGKSPEEIAAPVFTVSDTDMITCLSTSAYDSGKTLAWMSDADRQLFRDWAAVPENQKWF